MVDKILKWTRGRSTAFAAYFAIAGTVLQWFGKLSMPFVALVGAVQGYIVVHSIKEDYFQNKNDQKDDHKDDQK